jgi:hypothetical protein
VSSPERTSLIAKAAEQLDLIPSDQMPPALFERDEAGADFFGSARGAGEYTGARLFAQNPEKYRMIVSLLAESVGILRIGRILKVSPSTVIAVRDREPDAVEIEKQRLSRLARGVAHMCIEAVAEDLSSESRREKVSTRDKAIVAGVLLDKARDLGGGVPAQFDGDMPRPAREEWASLVAALSGVAAAAAASGTTGPGGKTGQQKGGPAPAVVVEAEYTMSEEPSAGCAEGAERRAPGVATDTPEGASEV